MIMRMFMLRRTGLPTVGVARRNRFVACPQYHGFRHSAFLNCNNNAIHRQMAAMLPALSMPALSTLLQ
jgi:hypothetical protein